MKVLVTGACRCMVTRDCNLAKAVVEERIAIWFFRIGILFREVSGTMSGTGRATAAESRMPDMPVP